MQKSICGINHWRGRMLHANSRRATHQEGQGGLFVALQVSDSRFVRAAQNVST